MLKYGSEISTNVFQKIAVGVWGIQKVILLVKDQQYVQWKWSAATAK